MQVRVKLKKERIETGRIIAKTLKYKVLIGRRWSVRKGFRGHAARAKAMVLVFPIRGDALTLEIPQSWYSYLCKIREHSLTSDAGLLQLLYSIAIMYINCTLGNVFKQVFDLRSHEILDTISGNTGVN